MHSVGESLRVGKNTGRPVGDSRENILSTALVTASENFHALESVDLEGQPHWLVMEENSALLLLGADMERVHKLEGNFEALDYRQWRNDHWILTADSVAEELIIYNLSKQGFKPLARPQAPAFALEGFCLYADTNNGLFAFLLGGDGVVEQRWLYDVNGQWLDKTIKVLPVGPGAETCAVDDASATLFVIEEDLGIWRYPAAAEASWQRKPLDFLMPWGPLEEIATIRVLAPGQLWAFGGNDINVYVSAADDAWFRAASWRADPKGDWRDASLTDGGLMLLDGKGIHRVRADDIRLPPQFLPPALPAVIALVETDTVNHAGDAADDPAIWRHPNSPDLSRVLATNKKSGLLVYDMQGKLVQSLDSGRINNVDLRQSVTFSSGTFDIAVASNRSDNSLTPYLIDAKSGKVTELDHIKTALTEVYGICLYAPAKGGLYAFINDKDGRIQQWRLALNASRQMSGTLVRELHLQSQPEGCVANDNTGDLFVGEEDGGLWRFTADVGSGTEARLLHPIGAALHADVEGIALIDNELGAYLLVSSQGNHSYAVFDAKSPFAYRGSFRIGLNSAQGIDGASETDGLELHSASFGTRFPAGLLVVQDGNNVMPQQPQNFKYVSWKDVIEVLRQR